jgi:hypothetical protein
MSPPSKLPPPPDRGEIPDEEPTQPDGYRARCPACPDSSGQPTGMVTIAEWGGSTVYRYVTRTCDICQGLKWIDRAQLRRWAERQNPKQ